MEKNLFELYQRLGAYFTGTDRRRVFLGLVLVGLVVILILTRYCQLALTSEALFWVFSSVAQSLVALIAFMGVVIVFKYQAMLTREEHLLETMNKQDSPLAILGGELDSISGRELREKISKRLGNDPSKEGFRATKLRQVRAELDSIEFVREFLSSNLVKFSVYILVIALLGFVLLALTPLLIATSLLTAIATLYVYLFLTAYAFFLAIKVIAAVFLH